MTGPPTADSAKITCAESTSSESPNAKLNECVLFVPDHDQ